MNITQIQENVEKVFKELDKERFVFDLLQAYGFPKSTILRLEKGGMNLSKDDGEIILKKKLYYKFVSDGDVGSLYDTVLADTKVGKFDPRFVVVTDGNHIRALDTKTKDVLDIAIKELINHFDFFLPWAGMEKFEGKEETIADVRAADKMAKFYDEISKDNPTGTEAEVHSLNVFLSRMLFCFFAEDTGIFEQGQFTGAISSHTQVDGSDLHTYLDTLWDVMNTDKGQRQNLPAYLEAFPYVNGGLFRHQYAAPKFTRRSRQMAIDMGELDWKAINPDIFGSMIQAVITPEHRGGLGMHYTSVPNIMKVIEPLFLNELYEEFEAAKGNNKKLNALLHRIWKIKIFDPACGSGNFLIIAYKELRKLEMKIFKAMGILTLSNISLSRFYGIELDDFAHEVAILSLWLAEHQMNQAFFAAFGMSRPALPLMETGHIVHGNACRVDWEEICPKEKDDEIYILGNPPYLGARLQKAAHKADMHYVFSHSSIEYNNLDYIAPWFFKGANYINDLQLSKVSFVSTNSICQGEQVAILWPAILENNVEIESAFKPFLWTNNAKDKAAVFCIIVCLRSKSNKQKLIFSNGLKLKANNINPYLIDYKNIFINKRRKQISKLPEMVFGSMANDDGNLILNDEEKSEIVKLNPESEKFFKKLVGAVEFTNNTFRWCLWITEEDLHEALEIEKIRIRVEKVRLSRLKSERKATNLLADKPFCFAEIRHQSGTAILIPRVTSERREYIQCGFYNEDTIILDRAAVIYGDHPFVFSILSSKIHSIWTHTVSGRLKMDINYAIGITYNAFPFPTISGSQKQELEKHVYRILEEREKHSEKTLAQLYDPDKMPDGLREAHHQNDLAIERCYRSRPFESDEERLEYLFKMYEQMIEEEKTKGTLFAPIKKEKKK